MPNPRNELVEALAETMDKQWWLEKLEGSKKTKKRSYRIQCENCQRQWDQTFPVSEGIDIRQVSALLDQAFGKPAETKRVDVTVMARTAEEMRELTTEQLLELAAG